MRSRLLVFMTGLLLSAPVLADPLLVAAGAGYKKPMMEIYSGFQHSSSEQVQAAFGNMQQVLAQVRDSGRVDLVVGEQGFLAKTGLFERFLPLGTGRLVLAWSTRRLPDYHHLSDPEIRRIALPDPKKAIYGRAATQFLERSGLQAQVADRLMVLATVPQVSAYLVAGTIDAGFINITDALGLGDRIAGFDELPGGMYDPPQIVLAVPKDRPLSPAARQLIDYVATPAARAVLTRYGL